MIIGISGKAGSGKDLVASLIQNATATAWEIKKFAAKVKEITSLMTGLPLEVMEDQEEKKKVIPGWGLTLREFMQRVATEAIRENLHHDAWVLSLFSDYIDPEERKWIITDLRFQNEFHFLREKGAILIRVERPGIKTMDHSSETDLDYATFDHTIINDGSIQDLMEKVDDILKKEGIDYGEV